MDTRKQQLRKVRPEDFDADALLRAAREGRLFIAPAVEKHPLTEVLDYVERIREYATNPHVREIWEAILSHEQLAPLFYLTRYAHLENTRVLKGQKVTRGQRIGQVGMSGNSFAPHLHYEIQKDTLLMDPLNYLFASVSPDEYMRMLFMSVNTGQSMD